MGRKKANREVCDVHINVLSTMAPYLYFDYANTTTMGFSADETYAKARGSKKIAFSNPIDNGSITIEAQITPFELYAMLSDGTIDNEAVIARKRTIECTTAGELALPAGVQAGSVFVYAEGEFAEDIIEGTYSAGKFIPTNVTDIEMGKSYEVGYCILKDTGVRKISFRNDKNPRDYYITMKTVEKDEDDVVTPYIIIAYKAKPKKSLDLSFSSEGDPATIKIEFSLLEDKNGNIIDMVELTNDED